VVAGAVTGARQRASSAHGVHEEVLRVGRAGDGHLDEFGQRDEEQRGKADRRNGARVKRIHFVAKAGGECEVLDALQASTLDVPHAALCDVS